MRWVGTTAAVTPAQLEGVKAIINFSLVVPARPIKELKISSGLKRSSSDSAKLCQPGFGVLNLEPCCCFQQIHCA